MNDITILANMIDASMEKWLYEHKGLDPYMYGMHKEIIKFIMKETKGHLNPSFVEQLVYMHKKPIKERGFPVQC